MCEIEEGNVLIQQSEDKAMSIKNSETQIKHGEWSRGMEFKDFLIGRAKSQQGIDDQIGRLDDDFQKNESSGESHELEREEYQGADE